MNGVENWVGDGKTALLGQFTLKLIVPEFFTYQRVNKQGAKSIDLAVLRHDIKLNLVAPVPPRDEVHTKRQT